jgi:hypothetical protein
MRRRLAISLLLIPVLHAARVLLFAISRNYKADEKALHG